MSALNEPFGQRVRVAIAVSRTNRRKIAAGCGVSAQAVQKWCDGSAFPSSANLIRFCEMTGCSADWLMWQSPVDIRSTDWAINGKHIKNIVRTVMDEMAEAGQ